MANFFEGQASLTPKERKEILEKGGPEALASAEAKFKEASQRIQAERQIRRNEEAPVIDVSEKKSRVQEKFSTESEVLAREARQKLEKAYERGGEKAA